MLDVYYQKYVLNVFSFNQKSKSVMFITSSYGE